MDKITTMKSYPYATLEQMRSQVVRNFLLQRMPKAQEVGMHFHKAFLKCAYSWNNGKEQEEYGFRLPYEFGKWKNWKNSNGEKVVKKVRYHIGKILAIKTTMTADIVRALQIDIGELWPEKISGNNQMSTRKSDENVYKNFWKEGGREMYSIYRFEMHMSPRDALRITIRDYNELMDRESDKLKQKGALDIFTRLYPSFFETDNRGAHKRSEFS